MENKVALITGASSGIGQDIGLKLQEKGYTIICVSKDKSDKFENSYVCDIGNNSNVDSVFLEISKKFKKIDVLVNNAGFGLNGALELADINAVEAIFRVNTTALVNITNHTLPFMDRGGKIINISSMAAFGPTPFRVIYGASKAAVNSISFGYNMELKSSGIGVCSICPGDVDSTFQANRIINKTTNDKYKNAVENDLITLEKRKNKRLSIDTVSSCVVKQIVSKKTKPLVIVGNSYKFFNFFKRILSVKFYLNVINKSLNKSK